MANTPLDLGTLETQSSPPRQSADLGYFSDMMMWILIAVIAAAVIGSVLLLVLRRRRLARSPRMLEGNRVTISGTVQAPATLEAALSGKRCVVHRSRARVVVGEKLVAEPRELEVSPFVVVTRHGPIRIDVRELALDVSAETVVDQATARQLAFRARHAIPAQAAAAYDEIVVEPGAKVTIRGIVAVERNLEAAGERGYRDDAPTTIHLRGQPSKPVTLLRLWH